MRATSGSGARANMDCSATTSRMSITRGAIILFLLLIINFENKSEMGSNISVEEMQNFPEDRLLGLGQE